MSATLQAAYRAGFEKRCQERGLSPAQVQKLMNLYGKFNNGISRVSVATGLNPMHVLGGGLGGAVGATVGGIGGLAVPVEGKSRTRRNLKRIRNMLLGGAMVAPYAAITGGHLVNREYNRFQAAQKAKLFPDK